ncbi:PilX N-terminal domain-containing pilus assembly protein [Azonexus sp.]|jgi:type IV pilus assembly protein PilX|uniref:pilus assembly PilX family protein n=1 Tax=Azonexus sp. TaxID=1872668 RepID=UPI00282282C3|nr:PilX N-terminal domain-containing pilus assembly protein [Azonexus sp.]MDR1995504.1 hypothetical protein [Azonexus sp.]
MKAARMFPFSFCPVPFPPRRARGFSLAVAMIFLLVLSMLALVGIRSVIMHERMAGNTQDWNLAFQAAEAALRDGEADAFARAALLALADLSPYAADGCGAVAGVCLPSGNGTPLWVRMVDDDPCWRSGTGACQVSQQYGAHTGKPALTDPNADGSALALQPRYVIENLGVINGGGSLPLKPGHYGSTEDASPQYAFRVTAVGFGKIRTPADTPATRVVLQTTIGMN